MNERIARVLATIEDFGALAQFEINLRRQNALDDEVASAIKARSASLGRALVSERTGMDLSNLTPAEERIVQAVSEYAGVMKKRGKDASRTFQQLRNRGFIGAAEASVDGKTTQGFQTLKDENLEELSYEQIILDYPEEFSKRAQWYARRTMGLETEGDRPPPRPRPVVIESSSVGPSAEKRTRNPNWTREEHILGLDLYLRLRGTEYPQEHPEVIRLSETLRALAHARGISGISTFRNANGVSMKMQNFRRIDPDYPGDGLPSGSKLEEQVWEEFAHRPVELAEAVRSILESVGHGNAEASESDVEIASINDPETQSDAFDQLSKLERQYVNASPEEKSRTSQRIERGPVGKAVKKAVGYRCQLCLALGLNPIGFIKANGTPYVEAHHVMPVHLKQVGSLSCTNVIVLCANHPRQLHYGQDISVDIAAESFVISIEGSVVEIPKVRADVKKADALL